MTESSALRRFLALVALRWLPSGMMIPVYVLLPLQRGLSLSELGLALAMQGVVVMLLELPTGGLADALGRRRVLLASMVFGIASTTIFLVAHSFALFAVAGALSGVYRALDSGPLDAWYVDAAHAANPQARIDRGMGLQGTVAGVAIATGAIATGAIAARPPLSGVEPLALAVGCSLALHVIGFVVTALLMVEQPRHAGLRGVLRSVREAPRTIVEGVGLLRASRVLLALVCVELFWGFGMFTFEGLFPARLAELLGDADRAAVITGPAASAAWIASAAGSAVTPWLGRRIGMARAAALLRVAQGSAVLAMGLFAGVVGVVVAYLACYAVHGTSGAAHSTLLHENATARVRATVVSLNSMFAQPAGALGSVALTALADGTSISIAIVAGAVILAVAAPLYLPAARAVRTQAAEETSATVA